MAQEARLKTSELRFYSKGMVASNMPLSALYTGEIEVTPIEALPFLDGELAANQDKTVVKGVNVGGQHYTDTVITSNTIKAKWLRLGCGSTITAPNLRRGEEVILYQFADLPEYWWTTLGDGYRLRRLETVIMAISGTKDEGATLGTENCYYFEWSSHRKLLTLHTSAANGEPHAWDLQLNTGESTLVVTDNAGQVISINSGAKRIDLVNADGTTVVLDQKNIVLNAPETVSINCKNLSVNASNGIALNTKSYSCSAASGSYSISNGYQVNAMSIDIQGSASLQAMGPGGGIVNAGGATSIS